MFPSHGRRLPRRSLRLPPRGLRLLSRSPSRLRAHQLPSRALPSRSPLYQFVATIRRSPSQASRLHPSRSRNRSIDLPRQRRVQIAHSPPTRSSPQTRASRSKHRAAMAQAERAPQAKILKARLLKARVPRSSRPKSGRQKSRHQKSRHQKSRRQTSRRRQPRLLPRSHRHNPCLILKLAGRSRAATTAA